MKSLAKVILPFSILIFVFILSCTPKKDSTNYNTQLDSILAESEDSLATNLQFSNHLILKAEKMAMDSMQFYMVKVYLSQYYYAIQKPDSAFELAKKIKYYAQKNPQNIKSLELLMSAYNSMGIYYGYLNNLDSALYYYNKCYIEAIRIKNNTKLPDICINLADMYTRKGDFVNGIGLFRRALSISDSLHLEEAIKFPIYFGLGQAYFMGLRNFELSDEYFKKAELLYDHRSLSEKFTFCNNRGNFYYYKEEYAQALPWFLKAKKIVEPLKSDFYINFCNANLGDIYLHLNNLDSAQYCLDKSYEYFDATGDKTVPFYISTTQVELALKNGNKSLAKSILDKNPIINSIEPEILGIRYKTLQNYYQTIADYRNAFEIQSRAIKLNDSIRSERVKNSIAELDARYRQDTTLMNKEILIRTKDVELNSLRSIVLLWILLTITAALIALSTYLFYKRKKDKEQAKYLEVVSKYRLQNLRSRISPHFLFNVLQRQINTEREKEKYKETLELIKMLRKSLEMTDQMAVNLSDEIEFVQSYLTIESNSFDKDLHIVWDIDADLDLHQWKVPAMMLQIPVENAIKHALRSKVGEKVLKISILKSNAELNISVVDNGKGYYPESNTATVGTKSGLKVLYSIIQLLNQTNTKRLKLDIINVEDALETGTKVEITIPENYNYSMTTI